MTEIGKMITTTRVMIEKKIKDKIKIKMIKEKGIYFEKFMN